MKLELKDITPYLPYALDIEILNYQCDYVGIRYSTITGCYHIEVMPHFNYEGGSTGKSFDEFKPLFLPLSALTEQLPDGSIPIVELAKVAFPNFQTIRLNDEKTMAIIDSLSTYDFKYSNDSFEVVYSRFGGYFRSCYVPHQLALFKYLYANHFWLGDQSLFETGEIIDKRTVTIP